MNTIFKIGTKKNILKYARKMPEKEVLKMKSFVTDKGEKLVKTDKFKIIKITEGEKSRTFDIKLQLAFKKIKSGLEYYDHI